MHFSSLNRHRRSGRSDPSISTSPFAFLDDPFESHSSIFLFVSTIFFATALVFYLMRHHWRCVRNYSAVSSSCEQCQKTSSISGTHTSNAEAPSHIDYDSLESGMGSTGGGWSESAHTGSEFCAGDAGLQGKNECFHKRWEATPAEFYTPATSRALHGPSEHEGAYCNCQISSGENMAFRERNTSDAVLAKSRMGQSQMARLPGRPAALQRVVVGNVKESIIAKRRLMLGNGA